MASGTAILAGVNVPHPTSSLDYTYDGTPVGMNATATLIDESRSRKFRQGVKWRFCSPAA
jgi:hypothetical protein